MAVIVCPSCSAKYRLNASQIAKASKLRCKKCGAIFSIQDQLSREEAPTEDQTSPQPPPDEHQLDFHVSEMQSQPASPLQKEGSEKTSQDDLTLDMNLDDLKLDFSSPDESSPHDFQLSFNDDSNEDATEDEEIQDHISAPLQPDVARATSELEFSFAERQGEPEKGASEELTLDFSFSADIPEEEPDTEEDEESEGGNVGDAPAGLEIDTEDSFPDGLNLGEPEEGEAHTMTAVEDHLAVSFESSPETSETSQKEPEGMEEGDQPPQDDVEEDASVTEEMLPTCCIDSLSMGLSRCEICGRNLEGKDQEFAKELKRIRKQQLREELIQGEVQVGFSEEQYTETSEPVGAVEDDFSDVERALDALADGTFHEALKHKEAKKNVARKLKMAGALVVAVLMLGGGILWYILPSAHEKLVARYEQLQAQRETDPQELARLFLDAAIEKDLDIFKQLSIMRAIPDITDGKILGAGEVYEEASLGMLGKTRQLIEQEVANLEAQIESKHQLLQEYAGKSLSPRLIQEHIKNIEQKIAVLEAEFQDEDATLAKKLGTFRHDLEDTEQELIKNRQVSRKYIDAVDKVGKALYQNSITKQHFLEEQKQELERQIQTEAQTYQRKHQELEATYQPRFAKLQGQLEGQQELLHEANLLQDTQKSPITVLSKELEQLTQTIIDKKEALEQTKDQLKVAFSFFRNPQEKNMLATHQDAAEFVHVHRNVIASIRLGKSSEQQVSFVLKRYQAILPDKTIQSDWLVEKIAK